MKLFRYYRRNIAQNKIAVNGAEARCQAHRSLLQYFYHPLSILFFMRISYSTLNSYQNCPLKYKFREIDKIKEPKSKEAVFGTLIHAVLRYVHTPSILAPSMEQALDYFAKGWNSEI